MSQNPSMLHTVLDAVDIRALAEFYRRLLGLVYRPGDEPPADPATDDGDWLVLTRPDGTRTLAFQHVEHLERTTWPAPDIPMQLHLDLTVPDLAALEEHHARALALGARLLLDRSDDPDEPLYVYADPAGHPFCLFVAEPATEDLDHLVVDGRDLTVQRAGLADVPAIVGLLRDDPLGAAREVDDPEPYVAAFHRIDSDRSHLLVVVRDAGGEVVGTMQLTLLPGLSRSAATRLQVEGVRVSPSERGSGLGAAMFAWAHVWGHERGASLAQLTTDLSRADAHRFYERLGYVATHAGLKRPLD